MNITLKNIKHAAFASEETHCFDATVYVDGKRAFRVSNQGHGGSDMYYPLNDKKTNGDVYAQVAEINAELEKEVLQCDGFTVNNSLEIVIGELVNQWLIDKHIKKTLKKLCYLKGDSVYTVNHAPTAQNMAGIQKATWWKPEYKLLNGLPIEEIRQYF